MSGDKDQPEATSEAPQTDAAAAPTPSVDAEEASGVSADTASTDTASTAAAAAEPDPDDVDEIDDEPTADAVTVKPPSTLEAVSTEAPPAAPPEPPPAAPPPAAPPAPKPLPPPPVPELPLIRPGPRPPDDGSPISDFPLEPPPASVPRPQYLPPPTTKPLPVVSQIEPDSGLTLGGTKLVLRGENLFRESIVRVGGSLATTVGAVEPREIHVSTPSRPAPGTVDITVQNPGADLVVVERAFRYVPLPSPTIQSVVPNRVAAKGGAEISLEGSGFVAETVVLLDGVEAKAKLVSSTSLEVTTPGGNDGRMVDVTVRNPDGKQEVEVRAFVYDARYD
jgi:IPT/TIG domain